MKCRTVETEAEALGMVLRARAAKYINLKITKENKSGTSGVAVVVE